MSRCVADADRPGSIRWYDKTCYDSAAIKGSRPRRYSLYDVFPVRRNISESWESISDEEAVHTIIRGYDLVQPVTGLR